MCGISGIINFNNQPVNGQQLTHMSDSMIRRGPDGEGYLATNNETYCTFLRRTRKQALVISLEHKQQLFLGHRRLATTDLSANAAQPMVDVTGRYTVVFNGQIYNHVPLRKELELKGYKFKTDHSDTEVLLNGYACWGIKCLEKFNGMWAFCIWDSVENTFFISRDRVGKQPIYYTSLNNNFYFASELNALLTNTEVSQELDQFALYDYLTYTNVPASHTIYKNIKKVPAAHYLFFKPGEEINCIRYWNPVTSEKKLELKENEIIDQIRERLYESTRLRMKADVNVGMLLSGGLDSSINLACLSRYSKGPVQTYSVGFENKNAYTNEFSYARNVASFFKADYHELLITEKDFFEFLPEMAYYQDEPIADTANIPIYFVSKLARKDNIKVLISGEGSDELFIGYKHWRLIYEFEKYFRNKPKFASVVSWVHKNSILKTKGPHYQTWSYKVKNKWPVFWGGTEVRTEETKRKILSKEFLGSIGNYSSFEPIENLYNSFLATREYDTFDWMTINDLQNRLPDQLLARLDRMMMNCSIEGRNPFLDVNLIEFVLRIPSELKVKNKTEKYLLKQAFKGILPNEIINRPKDSFTVPLGELFKNRKQKEHYMEIIREFNNNTHIFTKDYIKQLSSPENIKDFWNVLNLSLWNRKHNN